MHSRIEGGAVVITFDLAVTFDPETGGYFVIEQDGPPDLNHKTRWGPMPHNLVDAFIRERTEHVGRAWRQLAEDWHAARARQD